MSYLLTATLMAVVTGESQPTKFADFYTDVGPQMCAAIAYKMNEAATPADGIHFYCNTPDEGR